MDKKVIIFDMDGVLFDSIGVAREFFMSNHPGVTHEMYDEIHTGNFHVEAQKYSHLKIKETERKEGESFAGYSERKSRTPLFAGIKNLLKDLHKSNYILAMNTNAYAKNCLPMLERAGILSLFNFIPTAEISKDKVEKFKLIEEKYKVSNKDLLFITDALGDIRDADIAGVPTIAVTWGVHNKSFFEREKHHNLVAIIDTVEELRAFITKFHS